MKLKRFLTLTLMLLLTAFPALAAASSLEPTDDFYVNDSASVLDEATEGHIILNNDALYKACGAQIVIVTVDSTGHTAIEDYAYSLFNDWGIGSEKNNGLLLVMAIDDDDYWLLQGKGLQDYITAGDLDDLLFDDLEPDFARKDYSAGAKKLFDALFETVAQTYNLSLKVDDSLYEDYIAQYGGASEPDLVAPTTEQKEGSDIMPLVFLAIVCLVVVSICTRPAARPTHRPRRRSHVPPIIMTPRPPRPPRPPMGGDPHHFGGPAPHRPPHQPSGFGGSRPSRPSNFGGSRPSGFGGSRPSGFGGGRSGGGGMSRGGGAGRHR